MLKKLAYMGIALVMIFSVAGLLGCSGDKILEDGYFQYIVIENDEAAIVGLTKTGLEQEILVFPEMIGGKTVTTLGGIQKGKRYLMNTGPVHFTIRSEKLKKVFIPTNISVIYNDAIGAINDLRLVFLSNVLIDSSQGEHNTRIFDLVQGSRACAFINREKFLEIPSERKNASKELEGWFEAKSASLLRSANIEFGNNYSNEINGGYYWLDNIEAGEKILAPPAIKRDGYNFTGWYTEPAQINLWDFDKEVEIAEDTEFRLYAGWQLK